MRDVRAGEAKLRGSARRRDPCVVRAGAGNLYRAGGAGAAFDFDAVSVRASERAKLLIATGRIGSVADFGNREGENSVCLLDQCSQKMIQKHQIPQESNCFGRMGTFCTKRVILVK